MPDGQARRTRGITSPLVVLCVTQFVLQLDFSIVNIALRTIQEELDVAPASLQWIVTGYALTFGSLLLLGGRLGDRVGRRRLLLWGLWVFGAASLACGLAGSLPLLVGARFVQGAGAALVAPGVLAILTAVYAEGAARARALGIWTAATAAGGTTGIVLGGVLTQYLGWRSIFLVNIPLIAWLLTSAHRALPEVAGDREAPVDRVGAALVTPGLAALILGLSTGEQHGFGSTVAVVSFVVSALLLAAFVVVERRIAAPMVPFRFLAAPLRRRSVLVMLVVGGVFAAYAYFVALFCQRGLGFSELGTAVALVPSPLSLIVSSTFLSRRLIARFGLEPVLLAGLLLLAAGQLWLSRAQAGDGYFTAVLPALLVTSFGGGLVFPTVSLGITAGVRPEERGLAGGLLPAAQQVGSAVLLAVLATLATAQARHHGGDVVAGYRTAYLTSALVVLVSAAGVALSLRRRDRAGGAELVTAVERS
jgi:EmrB/QacA subfamily drug resistance transporter